MQADEYQCAICHEIFIKTLTDKEAAEQLKYEFPGFTPDECDIICDDCYQKYFGIREEELKPLQDLEKYELACQLFGNINRIAIAFSYAMCVFKETFKRIMPNNWLKSHHIPMRRKTFKDRKYGDPKGIFGQAGNR